MMLLYVTCKNNKEAEIISWHLMNKKLAACTNIFPIKSLYIWKGKPVKTREAVMLVKTTEKAANRVSQEIKKLHSYDIPCIIAIKSKANKEYEEWVRKETKER